jgi:hypothetical protein
LWHAAAESGSSQTFHTLLSWAKEAQLKPHELSKLLLVKKKYGEPVLYAAAESGVSQILPTLLSWAKEAQLKLDEINKLLLSQDHY